MEEGVRDQTIQDAYTRENEIVDAEKELANVELELELVQAQIKALAKPR